MRLSFFGRVVPLDLLGCGQQGRVVDVGGSGEMVGRLAERRQMVTLDTLREGERARVVDVLGDDAISMRLMEMGLVDGVEVELVGFAPLGDPIEFRLRGYRLSLRSTEARRVQVQRHQDG